MLSLTIENTFHSVFYNSLPQIIFDHISDEFPDTSHVFVKPTGSIIYIKHVAGTQT